MNLYKCPDIFQSLEDGPFGVWRLFLTQIPLFIPQPCSHHVQMG